MDTTPDLSLDNAVRISQATILCLTKARHCLRSSPYSPSDVALWLTRAHGHAMEGSVALSVRSVDSRTSISRESMLLLINEAIKILHRTYVVFKIAFIDTRPSSENLVHPITSALVSIETILASEPIYTALCENEGISNEA